MNGFRKEVQSALPLHLDATMVAFLVERAQVSPSDIVRGLIRVAEAQERQLRAVPYDQRRQLRLEAEQRRLTASKRLHCKLCNAEGHTMRSRLCPLAKGLGAL